jgi:hypothetical protein
VLLRRPFMRSGRPTLLGTAARTAVVAGAATAVVGGMRRHEERTAEAEADEDAQQSAAMAPAAPSGGGDTVAELERLADLKARGALTDAEFTAAKSKLLGT